MSRWALRAALVALAGASLLEAATVKGTIVLDGVPPPKVADRYNGGGPVRPLGGIPTVVYLEGAIPGHPPTLPDAPVVIAQKDLTFTPPLLVVPPGTSVRFPNLDKEFHNVFSYSPSKRFDLGRYPQGESKSVTFDKPGIVKIYCEIHEFMRAAVVVVENPFHAVPAADGSFVIEGVPPGEYRLVAWNIDRGSKRTTVRVTGGDDASVSVRLARHDPAIPVATVAWNAPTGATAGRGCCATP